MVFKPNARLNPRQVLDRRGVGGAGGIALGGGGIGVILLLAYVLLGGDPGALSGSSYRPAETVLFDGSVNTACGAASAAVGPFYCPLDTRVYLDLGFYDE